MAKNVVTDFKIEAWNYDDYSTKTKCSVTIHRGKEVVNFYYPKDRNRVARLIQAQAKFFARTMK